MATEQFLEHIDRQTWEDINKLTTEQQDEKWFRLTQKHLKDYEADKLGTADFDKEELELLYLNYLGAKNLPVFDPKMPQRGFSFASARRTEKFETFGKFIEFIKREADEKIQEQSEPLNILVSGIGISGKATIRNVLTKELLEKCPENKIISWDRDYQKIFPPKWLGDINIIEDVHGLDDKKEEGGRFKRFNGSEGIPEGYDVVVYSLPPAVTYKQTLVKRGLAWLKIGKMDLTSPNREYSENTQERIKETAKELEETLKAGQDWFWEQFRVLRELKKTGVRIIVVDPTNIFKKLYDFEEKPDLLNQDFLTALSSLK